jgi:glycosyltransferase involved in cell wall biosynthesis
LPKVSICIPAYNQIEYLKRTIDSSLSQSYTDYEIVITDDSSSNIVDELVKSYQLNDKIKYFKNAVALGPPENWNEAIRRASGEYIKIMHHDDWFYDENSLGKYIALLDNNPDVYFAFAATLASSLENNDYVHMVSKEQLIELKSNPIVLFVNNFVGAPSTILFRKNKRFFFDKKLKWLVDFDFYIRLLSSNNNFKYSNEVLTVTFKPKGRVTDSCENNKEIEIFEYFYLIDKLKKDSTIAKSTGYRKAIIKVISICKKYEVTSIDEVISCGYKGEITIIIRLFFKLNALSNFFGKAYLKFLNAFYAK